MSNPATAVDVEDDEEESNNDRTADNMELFPGQMDPTKLGFRSESGSLLVLLDPCRKDPLALLFVFI